MRHAWRNVNARTFLSMEQFVADLKIRTALENVKCLVCLDVVMRARLKSRLAILFHHFERLASVTASDFDNDLVGLGVNVSRARRRMLALHAFLHLVVFPHDVALSQKSAARVGWTPDKNSTTFDATAMRSRNHR